MMIEFSFQVCNRVTLVLFGLPGGRMGESSVAESPAVTPGEFEAEPG